MNFRAGLIRTLVARGHEVVTVAPHDRHAPMLERMGCRYIDLPMDNKGTNPIRDLMLMLKFFRLFRAERPDVFLGYTIKPNIYGSLAAHLMGIPVINNISGLGAAFISNTWLTKIVRILYRISLYHSWCVFFQNEDDRGLFVSQNIVRVQRTSLLPGSGVDLAHFYLAPLQEVGAENETRKPNFRFLLIARLLWDKGVREYIEAARDIHRIFPKVEFCLLGLTDAQNPASIPRSQVDAWVAEGCIRYLGFKDDVRCDIEQAHCVVLPSYREGTPRSLLEAAAMGRPIITTDTAGCRDVVDDGISGFLCEVRNSHDLAEKMVGMLRLTDAQRAEMGARGRKKIEREYDEKIVIQKYLDVIERFSAISRRW